MKQIATAGLCLFVCTYAHANQTTYHAYANTISAHNISTLQHNITQNAINGFSLQNHNTFNPHTDTNTQNPHNLYGHAPIYGSELIYGEFNDDGTMGRSGGDTQIAALSDIWLNWQHADNKTKFNKHNPIKNKSDLIIAGLAGKQSPLGVFTHNWGIHTGYTHSTHYNNDINIDSKGGFLGFFNGFYYNKLSINTNLTSGVFSNSADNTLDSDNFTNFWLSGAINTSYDLVLDSTFVLRPAINTEYTWIKSENYTSVSGDKITNKNFNIIEISPEIQAIKNISNDWFGKMNVKYVMTFTTGGDTTINTTNKINLNDTKYFEYGISVGKNIHSTNIHATIGRQDGDMYGWFGNINIKYLF